MASVVVESVIDVRAEEAWDAVRDFGAVHERLVPGFLTDAVLDGDVRTVTFFNGLVVRERLVGVDDDHRRLAYTNELPGVEHHSASVQVLALDGGRCRVVWITDVLPDDRAEAIEQSMRLGSDKIRETLEAGSTAVAGPVTR